MKKYLLAAAFALFSQFIFAQDVTETKPAEKTEKVYKESKLDTKPEYPGGPQVFHNVVMKNFRTPEVEKDIDVEIKVQFIVETDGTISDVVAVKDPGYGMGEEAIRVIKKINQLWKPGTIKGKPVRSYLVESIKISIKG